MVAQRALYLLGCACLFVFVASAVTGCTLFGDPGDYTASEGTADTGPNPDGTDGGTPICNELCTAVEQTCANFPQYTDRQHCLDVCAGLPVGTTGDYNGNTVFCRLNHLEFAAEDPATHCPHANPEGGGVCVGNPPPPLDCAAVCGRLAEQCGAALPELVDRGVCEDRCRNVPTTGTPGDLEDHTLQCRESFLDLLETGADKVLCEALPFAEALSQGCNNGPIPECQSLCLFYDAYCPGGWDSRDVCIEDCSSALSNGLEDAVDCALYSLAEGPHMCDLVDPWDPTLCIDLP